MNLSDFTEGPDRMLAGSQGLDPARDATLVRPARIGAATPALAYRIEAMMAFRPLSA